MESKEILQIAPHKYPMLLVDRIIECTDAFIRAIKNVTINEPFFQGHFPSHPIYPGIMQVEGIAQSAGFLLRQYIPDSSSQIPLFMKIEESVFLKAIHPGDQMIYEVSLTQRLGDVFKLKGKVIVNAVVCTKAKIMVGCLPAIQENGTV